MIPFRACCIVFNTSIFFNDCSLIFGLKIITLSSYKIIHIIENLEDTKKVKIN